MKMDHLGGASVTTSDGKTYTDADHLLVYDIDLTRAPEIADRLRSFFRPLAVAAIGEEAVRQTDDRATGVLHDLKDFKADVYVRPGVPALGVVRLMLSGDAFGVKFRIGFDQTDDMTLCSAANGGD